MVESKDPGLSWGVARYDTRMIVDGDSLTVLKERAYA